ncbi:Nuclear speckle splicing regulatory protein 1-like protein [Botrytis cinerea]
MPISMFGDLSSSLTSKKHAETAEELDANIYDYDAVYDSLKPKKKIVNEEEERKPKYMSNLIAAAAVRKRDSTIAEEKKLAREREAEGDEFADKEKFVTSAYKKQQEENRRIEEEERLKQGPQEDVTEDEKTKTDADIAREINEKRAGTIAINDEGQVVDKRELLKGGLNIIPKAKPTPNPNSSRSGSSMPDHKKGNTFVGSGGGKQAMRERQSRMMEAQLEQATKRALEEEEEEKQKVERASKSRKTEGDIMSAKERYLARKREAEEAKKKASQ